MKIINSNKHTAEEVLNSQVVIDLFKALGCGFLESYNKNKLNYGKIAIYTDGDVDGSSIMCLLLTLFYKYMPQLLIDKKIYWARAPLFTIKKNNKPVYYAYSEEEKDSYVAGKIGLEIKRNKG